MKDSFPHFSFAILFLFLCSQLVSQNIPLPEHPRPDFQRAQWQNLNGQWSFHFDQEDVGIKEAWFDDISAFQQEISVPFPWGSPLSGVEDEGDIGWYGRQITIDDSWRSKRIFLTVGAADWHTIVWLDGQKVGEHEGGYVPFSLELTDYVNFNEPQQLVIRVDDKRREFTLYGKQGYGNARGIWQTLYLQAKGVNYIGTCHITPIPEQNLAVAKVVIDQSANQDQPVRVHFVNEEYPDVQSIIPAGSLQTEITIPMDSHRVWSLKDPYLYWLEVTSGEDQIQTYFGMRTIHVEPLPGTDYPYVALNGEPIYLQMALDQSYHPEGFYTFPSDDFMKAEIQRSKDIGLNGMRTHVKIEIPRKLYWADQLGMLIMEDIPNSWGEPDDLMRKETEYALRQMIHRDFNHPSIFSWCIFNETWGLSTEIQLNGKEQRQYLPETQYWVASMYYLAKSLDPTRLVEDNSICCGRGHTETDINSWHQYSPGWEWDEVLTEINNNTYPGSSFHFEKGFYQGSQPNFNSECGNVWGYEGSTGDVDWSWDYHRMMNTFRMYPKIAGWLYTEHHDVINEWNGYWRYDRSEKYTGIEEFVDGMTLNDWHAPIYISTGNEICLTVSGADEINIPLYLSSMVGDIGQGELHVEYDLSFLDQLGEWSNICDGKIPVEYQPYMHEKLDDLPLIMPDMNGLAKLTLLVKDENETIVGRNFMNIEVTGSNPLPDVTIVSVKPDQFLEGEFSLKKWSIMNGLKMNGAGIGYLLYSFATPERKIVSKAQEIFLLMELSAKELFVKDIEDFDRDQDYMKGSVVSPSSNPNSYPMTDETTFPSTVTIKVNDKAVLTTTLPDDPADHRGVLSWHHQLQDKKLREAGSYGYLIKVPLKKRDLKNDRLYLQIETEGKGGFAVYGKEFGRYPIDPSLVVVSK